MNARIPVKALVALGASYYPALIAFWMVTAWTTLVLAARDVEPAVIGVFSAVPWVAVLLVSPLVPMARHRLGWRGSYQLGNLLAAASVAGFALTGNLGAWTFFAALSGAAIAVRWIVADAWAAAITPIPVQGRMVGAFETLAGTAIAVGPALVALTGIAGTTPILVLGILLAASIALAPLAPEPAPSREPAPPPRIPARGLSLAPWLVIVVVGVGGLFESGFGSMLPVFGVQRNLDAAQASLLMASANASALFLQVPVGWLADRCGPERVLRISSVLAVGAGLGVALAPSAPALFIAVFLWGGVAGTFYTLGRIIASRREPEAVLRVMSAVAVLYTLGAIVGPPLGGAALSGFGAKGFTGALVVSAVLFAVALRLIMGREGPALRPPTA